MNDQEIIASLKDEVKVLKGNLETANTEHEKTKTDLKASGVLVDSLQNTIKEKDGLIEALAAAPAAEAAATSASAGLEFKHKGKLFKLNELPDRKIIVPTFGEMTAAEAVKNPDVAAFLAEKGIAEQL